MNVEKIMTGSVTDIAASADWDAAFMLGQVGPERASALLTWARVFEQSIQDRIRARITELARAERQSQLDEWEQKALERSLRPVSSGNAPLRERPAAAPVATAEDLL